MLTLQVVRSMGAGRIIAADIDDLRLKTALENGAAAVVNTGASGAIEEILALTENRSGVQLAFDATGISATVNLCARACALNGKVVLIGNIAPTIDFPLQLAVTRQQTYFGSCASAGEYPQCLELIASGAVNVEAMISKAVRLSEGGEWMNKLYNREAGLYKIVLVM